MSLLSKLLQTGRVWWPKAEPELDVQPSRLVTEREALRVARLCSTAGVMLVGYARARLVQLDNPMRGAEALLELRQNMKEATADLWDDDRSDPGLLCDSCDAYGHGYMLKDEAWAAIADEGEALLCLPCADERHKARCGRQLETFDFVDVPINGPVMWMGRRWAAAQGLNWENYAPAPAPGLDDDDPED